MIQYRRTNGREITPLHSRDLAGWSLTTKWKLCKIIAILLYGSTVYRGFVDLRALELFPLRLCFSTGISPALAFTLRLDHRNALSSHVFWRVCHLSIK